MCDGVGALVTFIFVVSIVVLRHFTAITIILLGAIEALVLSCHVESPEVDLNGDY